MTGCRRFHRRVHALMDGGADTRLAPALQRHAAGCAACAQMRQSVAALAARLKELALSERMPPPDLVERVMAALPQPAKPRDRRAWNRGGRGGLMAVLGLIAGPLMARLSQGSGAGPVLTGWRMLVPAVSNVLDPLAAGLQGLGSLHFLAGASSFPFLASPHILPGVVLSALGLAGGGMAVLMVMTASRSAPHGGATA
ncbi:MAG: anti-sigma factor family protein [Acidobacteriota bacterium]